MTSWEVRQEQIRRQNLAQRTARAAAARKRKPGMGTALQASIAEMARGAPAQQAQAERTIRAQSQKQAQLSGTTGRSDVAAAREARTGEHIRQQRALIGEESRRAGIGQMMAYRQQQSDLLSARSDRRYQSAQIRALRQQTSQAARPSARPVLFGPALGRGVGRAIPSRTYGHQYLGARKKKPRKIGINPMAG